MNVTEPSRAQWVWQPDGPAVPADPIGWKPVQLVPENARRGRGGLPVDVPEAQPGDVDRRVHPSRVASGNV